MKLHVAAIGLLKTGPEKALAEDYETRIKGLGRKAGISGLTISDWSETRPLDEAKQLWSIVPAGSPVVALDERGAAMASVAFAAFLKKQADEGAKQLTFMIGGPDGHVDETRAKAAKLFAFGPMTWPHRFVRIMLLEQIYRAVTILVNHPYHRG